MAKVTSKGQVTVPKDVRDALGVREGDRVTFEVAGDHAIVRRAASIWEVREDVRARYGDKMKAPRHPTDSGAVEAYFREKSPDDTGDMVVVASPHRVTRAGEETPRRGRSERP